MPGMPGQVRQPAMRPCVSDSEYLRSGGGLDIFRIE
jgi:hypothetical protein